MMTKFFDKISQKLSNTFFDDKWLKNLRPVIACIFLIPFIFAYIFFAQKLLEQRNHDRMRSDQNHNIVMAQRAKQERLNNKNSSFSVKIFQSGPHLTDGVVSPLMPWIASFFIDAEDNADMERNFYYGKIFNLSISIIFLFFLLLICIKLLKFTLFASINLTLLATFCVFLPRAIYFQPEPIFYILTFLTWLCCLYLLIKNSTPAYALLGFLAALTYLTKSSISPMLAIFFAISGFRFICNCILIMLFPRLKFEYSKSQNWAGGNFIIGVIVFTIIFLSLIAPTLFYKKEHFGSYWHSYPSYWMWMDNFEPQAYTWMGEHNTKEKLAQLKKEEKPSLKKYLNEHTPEQVKARLKNGSIFVLEKFLFPSKTKQFSDPERPRKKWKQLLPQRGYYLIYLLIVLLLIYIAAILQNTIKVQEHLLSIKTIPTDAAFIALFAISALLAYIILYGWYVPIGKGDRFMMKLYLPLAFTLIWGAEKIFAEMTRKKNCFLCTQVVYYLLQAGLLTHIIHRIYIIYKLPIF